MSKSATALRKQRERQAKKGEVTPFSKLYRFMAQSPQFLLLSAAATKVFVILLSRFNGKNNGDLNIARSEMLNIGLGANGIVFRNAIEELVNKGFLIITRPGKFSTGCSLYALTCEPIDASPKHDFPQQRTPSNLWRNFPCTAPVQGQALRQCNALRKVASPCTASVLVDTKKDSSACTAPVLLLRSSHRQSASEAVALASAPVSDGDPVASGDHLRAFAADPASAVRLENIRAGKQSKKRPPRMDSAA